MQKVDGSSPFIRFNKAPLTRGFLFPLQWPGHALPRCLCFPACLGQPPRCRREDAEQFIREVRGDDPEMAAKLRIEEREL